jgi:hypothetical protein
MRWQRTRTTVMAKISRTLIPALALGMFLCAAAGPAGATASLNPISSSRGIWLDGGVSGTYDSGAGPISYTSAPTSPKATYTDSPLFYTSSYEDDPDWGMLPGAYLAMGASQTSSFFPSTPSPYFTRFTAEGATHVELTQYIQNAEVFAADSFFDIYFTISTLPSTAQSFTLSGWLSANTTWSNLFGGPTGPTPPMATSSVNLERVGGPVIASFEETYTSGIQEPFFHAGTLTPGSYRLYGGSGIDPYLYSAFGTTITQDAAFSANFSLGPFVPVDVIPEPLTMAGLFFGLTGLGAYIRRRK